MLKFCISIFVLIYALTANAGGPKQALHLTCKSRGAPNVDNLEIYSQNGSNWIVNNANGFRNENTNSISKIIPVRSAPMKEREYSLSAMEPEITAFIQGRGIPFYDFRLQLSNDIIAQSHIAILQNMGAGQFVFTCCPIEMNISENRAYCAQKINN